jgi:hypothetical protein
MKNETFAYLVGLVSGAGLMALVVWVALSPPPLP